MTTSDGYVLHMQRIPRKGGHSSRHIAAAFSWEGCSSPLRSTHSAVMNQGWAPLMGHPPSRADQVFAG